MMRFACLLIGLLAAGAAAGEAPPQAAAEDPPFAPLVYAPGPLGNPLKGFFPYRTEHDLGRTFAHSLEWTYVPLKDLMTGLATFTFDKGLEPLLETSAARGRHAVLRVYLDYPKEKASGVPEFLIQAGVKMQPYTEFGGGKSPDYSDERLIEALEKFIAEFGKRYDGDVRLGFLTLGLLGHWGEWHTYPHEDWFPKEEIQNRILRAYAKAFTKTRLLMRYPLADGPKLNIGYHDDSFAYSTLPAKDWHFLSLLQAAGMENAWKSKPIGGELRPEAQEFIWTGKCSDGKPMEDFAECVKRTHCSFLLYAMLFDRKLGAAERAKAEDWCRMLGYDLFVSGFRQSDVRPQDPFRTAVRIENRGVAPFYYDWTVELQVRTRNGQVVKEWVTDWRLTFVRPDMPVDFAFTQEQHGLPAETYVLFLRVRNPLPKGKPLLFSNKEQAADGWLKLGEARVTPQPKKP